MNREAFHPDRLNPFIKILFKDIGFPPEEVPDGTEGAEQKFARAFRRQLWTKCESGWKTRPDENMWRAFVAMQETVAALQIFSEVFDDHGTRWIKWRVRE